MADILLKVSLETRCSIKPGSIGYCSVLPHNKKRQLEKLKEKYPIKKGRIWTISQNYRDLEQALYKVKHGANVYVHIDLAILWIYDTGRQFSDEVK